MKEEHNIRRNGHLYGRRYARWDVCDSDGALGGVNVLPAGTARPKSLEPELAATTANQSPHTQKARAPAAAGSARSAGPPAECTTPTGKQQNGQKGPQQPALRPPSP